MSRPGLLRAQADADSEGTHDEREQTRAGPGDRFVARVREGPRRIEAIPAMDGVVWQDVRAAPLRKFRHVACQVVFTDRARVPAVLHGARDASAWPSRLEAAESGRRGV